MVVAGLGRKHGFEALGVGARGVGLVPGPGETLGGRGAHGRMVALAQGVAVEMEDPHRPQDAARISTSTRASGRTSSLTTTSVEAGGGSATQASRTAMKAGRSARSTR